ncbi:Hsp70 family protein [Paracoccus zeaxanthinifaciens]|uniref:Hsp70 family protein n=1 Tax=Paracoccus zeaxanthinifaciens TaxID=187400 RepID=UPI0003B64C5F|nr:Hsp70 family protein [Paracoccus zeaxanthinifaciens]
MADLGLGVDFGTSNSAAGFLHDGTPRLIRLEKDREAMPTTFFFDRASRRTLMGEAANRALLEGQEGRFMRALKRVLGTSLMHEKRQILGERVSFVDIIARILTRIREQAEAEAGRPFERVLSGRPVVFHGPNDPREAQAEADLRECYLAAGFQDVRFMAEPEAAAIASGGLRDAKMAGLIVDIGGGTSDFSVFRGQGRDIRILANHGVRIGGTDFDRSISIDHVMPALGRGGQLRLAMGEGQSPVPNAIFNDLATWEKIPFLYTPQTLRRVDEMLRLAHRPDHLSRLRTVIEDELGHDVAFAVEAGKIAANDGADAPLIDLSAIERALSLPLSRADMATSLAAHSNALRTGAEETLARAGLRASGIGKVVYVGGSSLMSFVPDTMRALFLDAEHSFSEVFDAVATGLAIAASDDRNFA